MSGRSIALPRRWRIGRSGRDDRADRYLLPFRSPIAHRYDAVRMNS
jgi:hypothetical protein